MAERLKSGRYVCLERLGEGAQGETYAGSDLQQPTRAVALKRFHVRGATQWKDVELAEREARVLSELSHPKLPAYIDRFEEDGSLWLVMERIEGESLADLRRRGATLAERDIVRLLEDASDVLAYLHARAPAVIHRDLKPGNVIRRPDGSFAFVDFGAVRDKLRPKGGSTMVGTFGYMAPEQFQGRASPASDVYAIGATALTLLTGVEPEDLPHRGLAVDVRAALRGRASEGLVRVLERMMDPDPDTRADRIAPLLHDLGRDGARADVRAGRERHMKRQGRRAAKKAERAVRRAERRGERSDSRTRRGFAVPWPIRLAMTIAFAAVRLAMTIALQLAVPLVLFLLSVFFGPALRRAAESVRKAGHVADDALDRASRYARGDLAPTTGESREDAPPRIRVDAPPAARTSPPVVDVELAHDEEQEEEEDAGVVAEQRRKR